MDRAATMQDGYVPKPKRECQMNPQQMEQNIVRRGTLVPCKTAFIDAHTPGSDQKENFTIIGGFVSKSAGHPGRCHPGIATIHRNGHRQ